MQAQQPAQQQTETEESRFDPLALRYNHTTLTHMRTGTAIISGFVAGTLGLTGLYGFGFFLLASLVFSLLVLLRTAIKPTTYFRTIGAFTWDGLIDGVSTYLLCWTFIYGMVHVY